MTLTILLFVLGFIILIVGANFLVLGAGSIGKRFSLSDMVIGLTIVALGTSMPELIISVMASLSQSTDLAIANVMGSNIFNIYVIIGITAIIYPVNSTASLIKKDLPFCAFASILLLFCVNDQFFYSEKQNLLTRWEGIIFLVLFLFYIINVMSSGKGNSKKEEKKESNIKTYSWARSSIYIIVGLVGLYFGGEWIVDGAIVFANKFGMEESVIGLTIVAFGTSLPELATSIVAATKKQTDLAIGNAVGSSIFNILLILGVSSTITSLSFDIAMNQDLIMVILTNFFLLLFIWTGKGARISRSEGVILISIYLLYMIFSVGSR